MAINHQNLVPPVRTTDEARARGRNGGIASGKARRAKKTMRERAQLLLDCKLKDEDMLATFATLGIKTNKLTIADAMLLGQMVGAITGKGGDPRAFKAILDLVETANEQERADNDYNQKIYSLAELLNDPRADRDLKEFEDDG